MAYLNLDLDYFEHPKTLRLIGLLGKGAEVLPIKLWRFCGKYHAEDGKLTGYSVQEIESAVGWWGDPGKAVEALSVVGFLDKSKKGYEAHDWIENQGHIAAYKKKGRDMALARWGHAASIAASNAEGKGSGRSKQCHSQPIKPTKKTNLIAAEPPGFLEWWKKWPPHDRKVGRTQCLKTWRDRGLEVRAPEIVACLDRFRDSRAWAKADGEYIPMPMTWLNKAPWETDPADLIPEKHDSSDIFAGLEDK